jgi:putative heme transporter
VDEPLVPESGDPARAAAAFVVRGGRVAWGFVGLCLAAAIVLTGLAVASGVVLPLFLAVVLAMVFRPAARWLQGHRVPRPLAAGIVVVALVVLSLAFVWMVTVGIVRAVDDVKVQLERAVAELDLDTSVSDTVTTSAESVEPTVTTGVIGVVVSGIDMVAELIAGIVLGLLILYYLLKDGRSFLHTVERRMLPERAMQLDLLAADSTTLMRRYWLGRTVVSAVVAGVVGLAALAMGLPMVPTLMAVTFVGGYIPYIGAFIGGLLAVIVAIAENGLGAGVVMLLVVLVANLLIENMVDPHVTGRTLRIHPLVVLLVTTAGGILGGLIGLMMAVPMTLIAVRAARSFRVALGPGGVVGVRPAEGEDRPGEPSPVTGAP